MKAPATIAALSIVLAGGAISSARANPAGARQTVSYRTYRFPLLQRGALRPVMRPVLVAQQTTGTTTPTTTPTASPTVSPTPTVTVTPTYPDGVTVLQASLQVYTTIVAAHVKLVTKVEKPNVQRLTITATGNAFCKGPSLSLKVTGVAELLATKQKAKATALFAQKGKTTLERANKAKSVWKKVNANKVTVFGFPYPIGNPLVCPNAPQPGGGGSGTTTDTFKDVVNQGPAQFKGQPVWSVTLTDVRDLGGTNGTIDIPITLLINQKNYIPYVISQTVNDTVDGIVVTDTQTTTKVGEKYKFKLPRVGSK